MGESLLRARAPVLLLVCMLKMCNLAKRHLLPGH